MSRTVTIPERTTEEEIISYEHNPMGSIVVRVGYGEQMPERLISPDPLNAELDYTVASYFKFDSSTAPREIVIQGEHYEALLSDKPEWHPEKLGNVFEKNDLFFAVDAIEQKVPLKKGGAPRAEKTPPSKPVKTPSPLSKL